MKVRERLVSLSQVAVLERALRVRPITARCLVARGIESSDAARAFLEPRLSGLRSPRGLAGLPEAVERIVRAVTQQECIGVFGDYDVDGVTTAALLSHWLRSCGATVVTEVASRTEGYGFTLSAATRFAAQACQLVITGDCGTSDLASIEYLRSQGCDTVVVDHHTVPALGVPHPAVALMNPYRDDSSFPFRGMASVGLAFYLAGALRTALRDVGHFRSRPEPDVRQLLDLVALGTVADLVPLVEENRIITSLGLRQLMASPRPGVAALLQSAGAASGEINAETVAWKLAPRLNAPGRLGAAASALEMLLAPTADAANHWAAIVEEQNTKRRGLQEQVALEAERLAEHQQGAAVVVSGIGWPSGVVGIVAAKLVEKYQRPAFVMAIDPETGEARGSARTTGGIDLYQALTGAASSMIRFGGHAAAAGFTLRSDMIETFREQVDASVGRLAEGSRPVSRDTEIDAVCRLADVDERLAAELATLGPFGQHAPAPLLVAKHVQLVRPRAVGDGTHLKVTFRDGEVERSGIGFGLGMRSFADGMRVDVLFTPSVSTWQGRHRVEFMVKDMAPSA